MATLKELMGDKTRGDGRMFRLPGWPEEHNFEPVFKADNDNTWYGITAKGYAASYGAENRILWSEWHPPKKKIKRWLWAAKDGSCMTNLLSEQEAERMKAHTIKLLWSETEFEE